MIYRSCRIECVWSGEANDGGNNDVRVIGAPTRSSHHHLGQLHSKWFDQMIDYGSSQLAFAEGASARIWPIDEHANIRRVFFSLVVPLVMVVAVIGLTVWRIMLARWTTVLEGDQLVFRRAGKELRCDLATADLRLDWTNLVERRTRTASGSAGSLSYPVDTPMGQRPSLFFRPAGQSQWTAIALFDPRGRVLPAEQLLTIADTIEAHRPDQTSVGDLRRLADDHNPTRPTPH